MNTSNLTNCQRRNLKFHIAGSMTIWTAVKLTPFGLCVVAWHCGMMLWGTITSMLDSQIHWTVLWLQRGCNLLDQTIHIRTALTLRIDMIDIGRGLVGVAFPGVGLTKRETSEDGDHAISVNRALFCNRVANNKHAEQNQPTGSIIFYLFLKTQTYPVECGWLMKTKAVLCGRHLVRECASAVSALRVEHPHCS